MRFIIKLLIVALAVYVTAYILPGIHLSSDFWTVLVVAFVISLLNVTIKPILVIITIPITVLTLGLFLLVINALIIMLTGSFVDGFEVDNFLWALLFSLIVSIIVSVFDKESKKG
jgi:putative membrane protein